MSVRLPDLFWTAKLSLYKSPPKHDPEKWILVFGQDHARKYAQVAQLVEHCTENAGVGGSIPPLGTTNINELAPADQRLLRAWHKPGTEERHGEHS